MKRSEILSTKFTDEELREALAEANTDLETNIRLGCRAAARNSHIARTAIRRWIDDRKARAQAGKEAQP